MIEIILILIGIGCLVGILQSQEWYDEMLLKLYLYRRPFTCAICLSYWVSLVYLIIKYDFNFYFIFISAISSIVGELVYRKLNNML